MTKMTPLTCSSWCPDMPQLIPQTCPRWCPWHAPDISPTGPRDHNFCHRDVGTSRRCGRFGTLGSILQLFVSMLRPFLWGDPYNVPKSLPTLHWEDTVCQYQPRSSQCAGWIIMIVRHSSPRHSSFRRSSPQTFITPYLNSDIHHLRRSSPQTFITR